MNFLAPLFLAGIGAVAIPVIIHLINRERKVPVEFPSLMFLQRIPYRSVRRQKLRHFLLLALRCLALALLVAAFARPFFERRHAAIGGAGARELVVLLDRSASMGYGDRWDRARAAAKQAVAGLSATDHATLVVFARDASVASPPQATPERMAVAIDAATVSAEGTRYAPALKLASQIVTASALPRREVVLISDFQKVGWTSRSEVTLPPGTKLTPIDLGGATVADVAVSQVTTSRDSAGARDRVVVAARLVNTGAAPATVSATLSVGGRDVQTEKAAVAAHGARQVAFAPIAVPSGATRGTVRIAPDLLRQDDVLSFTIAPDEAVPVLVVEPASPRPNQGLFLTRALAIGDRPAFRVDEKTITALTSRDLEGRALVILNEVEPPNGAAGARLRALVRGGVGLVIVPGGARVDAWSPEWRALLPASIGPVTDRMADAGGTLSSIDYAHPVFELFNAPRSGDFSTARFYRYRALSPVAGAGVSARFDDGRPALVERAVGEGKVLVWASGLDAYWSNLPLQPVFLPFVHQLGKHAGRYADPRAWFVAGDVVDLSRHGELTAPFLRAGGSDSSSVLVLQAPSGARERLTAAGANHIATLSEQGFYELRGPDTPVGGGRPIAVNVDPAESDLSHLDPREIVAAVTLAPGQQPSGGGGDAAAPRDQEGRQNLWWYLLLGALLLMGAETAMSNRLSRVASS